jgi:hypothetical protein
LKLRIDQPSGEPRTRWSAWVFWIFTIGTIAVLVVIPMLAAGYSIASVVFTVIVLELFLWVSFGRESGPR